MRTNVQKAQPWIKMTWVAVVFGLIVCGFVGYRQYTLRKWDAKTRFTVVNTLNGKLSIESFDVVNKDAIRFDIPEGLVIDTVGGRGKWKVGALPELSKKYGWKWVSDSVADYLGITYTVLDREMGWWDRFNWWWVGRDKDWRSVTLDDLGLILEQTEVDGERVMEISSVWKMKSKDWFGSVNLINSGVGVKVINTTEVAGLGVHAARALESSGIKINNVKSGGDVGVVERCVVRGTNNTINSIVTVFVRRVYGCDWQQVETGSDTELELFVGNEYKEWWLGEFGS